MIEDCKPRSDESVFYSLFKFMIVLFVSLIDSIAVFYIVNSPKYCNNMACYI